MKLKYLILSLVIICVILIILIIVKPTWFFKNSNSSEKRNSNGKNSNGENSNSKNSNGERSNKKNSNGERSNRSGGEKNNNIDFIRTSQNGDMTLNPLFRNAGINNFANNIDPPPTPAQPNNIRQYIRETAIRQRPTRARVNAFIPEINNIRPPDPIRVDILIPRNEFPRNANGNEFMDMVFNDAMAFLQRMPNNEFNFVQHMNEANFHPIILNDNALLMDILDNHLMDIMGAHRDNIIQTRQDAARENAETGQHAVNNYLDIAALPTNDTQNVHDHTVLAGFKLILERLKSELGDAPLEDLEDIINEIKKRARFFSDNRPQLTLQVLSVIDKMKEGEQISALEINGEPTTDAICLQLVWNRANHPLNKEKKDIIKQAIFDNLLDCWETNIMTGEQMIVCVTGRATRMLGSLTLLDFDQRNWEVKKFEEFKNEIFNNVKLIIQKEATHAANSSDIDMQNAGKTYLATTRAEIESIQQPSEDAIINLNNIIKEEISNMIDSYVEGLEKEFFTEIPSYMKNSVKKEALASIDLF